MVDRSVPDTSQIEVTYWGVRGTIATPGIDTIRYGGNTACVSVEAEDAIVVLDSGTGARNLGEEVLGRGKRIVLAFSHRHFDHISGFPYFAPLFDPDQEVVIVGIDRVGAPVWYPTELLDGAFFPMLSRDMPCRLRLEDPRGFDWWSETGLNIERFPVNHPGGASGFRIGIGDSAFVHVPDNELGEDEQIDRDLENWCRGATILSHDAQFLLEDLPEKSGWGHSTMQQTCELAARAGVTELVLFHHDPARTDDELDRLNELLSASYPGLVCTTAYEGLTLTL